MSHDGIDSESLPVPEKSLSRIDRLTQQLLDDRAKHAKREQERKATAAVSRERNDDFDLFPNTSWKVVAGGDPGYLPKTSMRKTAAGFMVACRCCGLEFDSKGLAYCLKCREIPAEERRQIKPTASGRLCQAPSCENFIPRRARAGVQYCSDACRQRARRERKNVTDNPDSPVSGPTGSSGAVAAPAALADGPTGPSGAFMGSAALPDLAVLLPIGPTGPAG
jgi:hypothetical protein